MRPSETGITNNPKQVKQLGFTLMELIVTVAVISILLTITLLAIKPNETQAMRTQVAQIKGLLVSLCDQAAFDQHVYLMVPTDRGLSAQYFEKGEWLDAKAFPEFVWAESLQPDWELGNLFNVIDETSSQGWACWPSGEMTPGQITLESESERTEIVWTAMMQFETHTEQLDER